MGVDANDPEHYTNISFSPRSFLDTVSRDVTPIINNFSADDHQCSQLNRLYSVQDILVGVS
jgi:hypothetical protein